MLADQINLNFENGVRLKKMQFLNAGFLSIPSLKEQIIPVALIKIF